MHFSEHLEDPGVFPFPSLWATEEMQGVERRTNARRTLLDQCMLGGRTQKATCISNTLDGFHEEFHELRCDGQHKHQSSVGFDADGNFRTRKLQTYPSELCRRLARAVIRSFCRMAAEGSGPGGWLRGSRSIRRVSAWSLTARGADGHGVSFLNELAARGTRAILDGQQHAFYLHVDDGLLMSERASKSAPTQQHACDQLLPMAAEGLENIGFVVSDQLPDCELEKIVGYVPVRKPAELRLPEAKGVHLSEGLRWTASCRMVHTGVLRALTGVWIWGALLRRELLCIPHAVFRFMDAFPDQLVSWWPSARREVECMAAAVPLMVARLGAPLADTVFATDAMGASELDSGGFGIVGRKVDGGWSLSATAEGWRLATPSSSWTTTLVGCGTRSARLRGVRPSRTSKQNSSAAARTGRGRSSTRAAGCTLITSPWGRAERWSAWRTCWPGSQALTTERSFRSRTTGPQRGA